MRIRLDKLPPLMLLSSMICRNLIALVLYCDKLTCIDRSFLTLRQNSTYFYDSPLVWKYKSDVAILPSPSSAVIYYEIPL